MFGWFKKKQRQTGPDFSGIDSQAKAEEMFQRGDLEKLQGKRTTESDNFQELRESA